MSLNLVQAWKRSRETLEAAGISGPVIDARLLVEAAAGATRADIVTDPYRPLTAEQEATLSDYLDRRSRREPVSHILGRKGFWKIMLQVTAVVLTPRQVILPGRRARTGRAAGPARRRRASRWRPRGHRGR